MKTQVGTVIAPDGTETTVRPSNGKKFDLEELQKAVGGYIELVVLRKGNGHAMMYCNEEGKLERLAPNPKASAMALSTLNGDFIVGSVIVVRTEERVRQ